MFLVYDSLKKIDLDNGFDGTTEQSSETNNIIKEDS